MKQKISGQKTSQPAPDQTPSAGPGGLAITSPAYGLESIDQGLIDASPHAPGLIIQPRLVVGAAGDPYEQEADRVAGQVMKMAAPATPPPAQRKQRPGALPSFVQRQPAPPAQETVQTKLFVQRSEAGRTFDAGNEVESAIGRQQNTGSALPRAVRSFMEPRFGSDFSHVRVHTDGESDRLNRSLSARAFTTGQHIFFKRDDYNPASSSGRELIAHELTHVVQQNRSLPAPKMIQRRLWVNREKILDVDKAWDQVKGAVAKESAEEAKKLLTFWINSAGGLHFQFRRKGPRIRVKYDTWDEVAERLNQDLKAQESLAQENKVALDLSESKVIKKEVGDAVKLISRKVGTRWNPKTWFTRASENYRRKIAWYKPILYLASNVHSYELRKIFEILKYVTEEYGKTNTVAKADYKGHFAADEAPDELDAKEREVKGDNPQGESKKLTKDVPYRRNWWTPIEKHAWVKQARKVNKPIMAGPSNTTHRILQVAQAAGCTAEQLESIAWAAFIYWNRSPKNIAAGHTFHEVMDIANASFNVPYADQRAYAIPERYAEKKVDKQTD